MDNHDARLTKHNCWSCKEQFTLGEICDNDGYCPDCNAEQDNGSQDDDGPADGYRGDNW